MFSVLIYSSIQRFLSFFVSPISKKKKKNVIVGKVPHYSLETVSIFYISNIFISVRLSVIQVVADAADLSEIAIYKYLYNILNVEV